MSVFATSFLSGSAADMNSLKTSLEGKLPARVSSLGSTGLVSTTSATVVDLDAAFAVTNVEADDLLLYLFQCSGSVGDSGAVMGVRSFINSDDLANHLYLSDNYSNIDGKVGGLTTFCAGQDYSGTVNFYQKFWKESGTGTVYSLRRRYTVIQFKKRT